MTDGKTDDILVNCITMLATVPFFELPMSLNGEKCQKAACFCGVERIKTKGRTRISAHGGGPAAENLNGVIVH